jgi:hypothetical protein
VKEREKSCSCGKTKGQYKNDGLNAVYSGGLPLGFDNFSLARAIRLRPENGLGSVFEAWVMPEEISTMEKAQHDK